VAKYTVTFAIGSPALRPAVIHGTDYAAIAAGLIDKNRAARDNRARMKSEGIREMGMLEGRVRSVRGRAAESGPKLPS
jgi:hypothetical protein